MIKLFHKKKIKLVYFGNTELFIIVDKIFFNSKMFLKIFRFQKIFPCFIVNTFKRKSNKYNKIFSIGFVCYSFSRSAKLTWMYVHFTLVFTTIFESF